MSALALAASVVITLGAAGCAALLVVPAPLKRLAFLALVVDEKTWVVAGAAILAAALARGSREPAWISAQLVLTIAIVGVSLIPVVRARSLAAKRHVTLDVPRWLAAPLDVGVARPDETIVYATADGHPLALDVYRPDVASGAGARVPAGIVIHGGAWAADRTGG